MEEKLEKVEWCAIPKESVKKMIEAFLSDPKNKEIVDTYLLLIATYNTDIKENPSETAKDSAE